MTSRTNARIAGFAFLFYIVVGVTQMVIDKSAAAEGIGARLAMMAQHAPEVRINIVLGLVIGVTAITLAVALFGLTRDVDRDLAVLGLSFRLGEGMLAVVGVLAALGLQWLANGAAEATAPDPAAANALGGFLFKVESWNETIAAFLFAVGSTVFSWLLLRGRLIPVGLAWLGVVASVLLVVCLPLRLVQLVPGTVIGFLWLPMALFEIPLALWLLIKGVRPVARRMGEVVAA